MLVVPSFGLTTCLLGTQADSRDDHSSRSTSSPSRQASPRSIHDLQRTGSPRCSRLRPGDGSSSRIPHDDGRRSRDTADCWLLTLGAERVTTESAPAPADCAVSGTASTVPRALEPAPLWSYSHRRGRERVRPLPRDATRQVVLSLPPCASRRSRSSPSTASGTRPSHASRAPRR